VKGWLTLGGWLLLAPLFVLWWATKPLRSQAGLLFAMSAACTLLGLWLRAR
jgi:hypothetical protein